ncbi:hypothetical protein [Blastococcus sp. TF02-09]|uniref:hypothetical protein n=1 Tax=Blastococcus sp. TF02-09 TaxID=2250576 RepID=UPI001F15CAA7|nr:hypothetical protein [Blastococcus sp. TF02-9]
MNNVRVHLATRLSYLPNEIVDTPRTAIETQIRRASKMWFQPLGQGTGPEQDHKMQFPRRIGVSPQLFKERLRATSIDAVDYVQNLH